MPRRMAWKRKAGGGVVAGFDVALIVGYWLTNLLGFVLLHRGARQLLARADSNPARSGFKQDLLVSLGYTALIVLLIKFGVLKPIEYYFSGN